MTEEEGIDDADTTFGEPLEEFTDQGEGEGRSPHCAVLHSHFPVNPGENELYEASDGDEPDIDAATDSFMDEMNDMVGEIDSVLAAANDEDDNA